MFCLVLFVLFSDIDLKEAQRFFAQKFSCGASVTADDEIIIQGDFTDDIIDVIQEKWPEVMVIKQFLKCVPTGKSILVLLTALVLISEVDGYPRLLILFTLEL